MAFIFGTLILYGDRLHELNVIFQKWFKFQMRFFRRYAEHWTATTNKQTSKQTRKRNIYCVLKSKREGIQVKQYYKWWNITFSNQIEKVSQFIFFLDRTIPVYKRKRGHQSLLYPQKIGIRNFESIGIRAGFFYQLSQISIFIHTHINKIGFSSVERMTISKE